jgi:Fe2+ transport system protein B
MLDIFAVETVAQSGKDLVDVLQLLALPVILATIPYIFKQRNEARKQADKVVEAVTSNQSAQISLLDAMESTFIHIGEIKGDIKELKEDSKQIHETVKTHIESHSDFVEETREVRFQIIESIEENSDRISQVDKKIDRHLDDKIPPAHS